MKSSLVPLRFPSDRYYRDRRSYLQSIFLLTAIAVSLAWVGNSCFAPMFRPLCIVMQCPQSKEEYAINFINHHYFPDRFTLIMFFTDPLHEFNTIFPVNYLRNLAIRNIRTTHFLVTDMDLRLSSRRLPCFLDVANAYNEFMHIPRFILESSTSAVIMPIFFYNHTVVLENCDSIEECDEL